MIFDRNQFFVVISFTSLIHDNRDQPLGNDIHHSLHPHPNRRQNQMLPFVYISVGSRFGIFHQKRGKVGVGKRVMRITCRAGGEQFVGQDDKKSRYPEEAPLIVQTFRSFQIECNNFQVYLLAHREAPVGELLFDLCKALANIQVK